MGWITKVNVPSVRPVAEAFKLKTAFAAPTAATARIGCKQKLTWSEPLEMVSVFELSAVPQAPFAFNAKAFAFALVNPEIVIESGCAVETAIGEPFDPMAVIVIGLAVLVSPKSTLLFTLVIRKALSTTTGADFLPFCKLVWEEKLN